MSLKSHVPSIVMYMKLAYVVLQEKLKIYLCNFGMNAIPKKKRTELIRMQTKQIKNILACLLKIN